VPEVLSLLVIPGLTRNPDFLTRIPAFVGMTRLLNFSEPALGALNLVFHGL
jgi:hypothetical protein